MAIQLTRTEKRINKVNRLVAKTTLQFNNAIAEFADVIVLEAGSEFAGKIALDLFTTIVLPPHPVKTGRARAAWRVGVGEVAEGEPRGPGATAQQIIDEETAKLDLVPFGATIYISNGVKYIAFLEDGHSDQAPGGMVRIALEKVGGFGDVK